MSFLSAAKNLLSVTHQRLSPTTPNRSAFLAKQPANPPPLPSFRFESTWVVIPIPSRSTAYSVVRYIDMRYRRRALMDPISADSRKEED